MKCINAAFHSQPADRILDDLSDTGFIFYFISFFFFVISFRSILNSLTNSHIGATKSSSIFEFGQNHLSYSVTMFH